jgi:hypothetical protein
MSNSTTNEQAVNNDTLMTGDIFKQESGFRTSNIKFIPAQNTEHTKVFVTVGKEDVELTGVVRAKLDYDPELGFPTLHLEIVNPVIGNYI